MNLYKGFTFKKCRAAFIVMDIAMVLLLFVLYGRTGREEKGTLGNGVEVQAEGTSVQEATEIKRVALTFDDGPHYAYTKVLLDGLKEREVVATFFVTGEHAALHPDLVKRMHDEGHLVGNHTYSHMQLQHNNREEYKEELILTNEVLEEIIGEEIIFVRPPYGSWDKRFEEELNMIPVLWTVDPLDWCSNNVQCIVQNTICDVGENDIILMHDYFETSVTAALKIVDKLLEEGFVFVTVEEILFE